MSDAGWTKKDEDMRRLASWLSQERPMPSHADVMAALLRFSEERPGDADLEAAKVAVCFLASDLGLVADT